MVYRRDYKIMSDGAVDFMECYHSVDRKLLSKAFAYWDRLHKEFIDDINIYEYILYKQPWIERWNLEEVYDEIKDKISNRDFVAFIESLYYERDYFKGEPVTDNLTRRKKVNNSLQCKRRRQAVKRWRDRRNAQKERLRSDRLSLCN